MKFVFDVDGTICFNGQFIEPELVNEIKRIEKQNEVIFASARPIRDLLPVVRNFEYNFLIGGNGSIISREGEIEVIKAIPGVVYSKIKDLIRKYHLKYIIDGAFDYASNVSESSNIYQQLDPDNLANKVEMEAIEEPIKIILIDIPEELFIEIKRHIAKLGSNISILYHDGEHNIDITAKGINKFSTLKKIIGNEAYIAYGNDVNDYELLQNAAQSFYVSDNVEKLSFDITEVVKSNFKSLVMSLKKL
ncbi:HAD-IIB family hydrolase [Staphylococcus ratti]|uniref:HAD family hydrolase n=1 Tax=Staphylococcus ratti TaxID=2892440 RepID=A0ABY3PBK8_9STAP|nr:HAD-IIB family hydrolase [Staphylococcus ratti]UEX89653.1 HAD family hydrolase [Staphylococcus ratti]